jgi:hypothetical protein
VIFSEIHRKILKWGNTVFHKLFGQHFEQDNQSLQKADNFVLHSKHVHLFAPIVLEILHSLHSGREPCIIQMDFRSTHVFTVKDSNNNAKFAADWITVAGHNLTHSVETRTKNTGPVM